MDKMRDLRAYKDVCNIGDINFMLDKYKCILIVEGRTDLKTYSALFNSYLDVYIYPANCKKNVQEMLKILNGERKKRCRAIIDRDYDYFIGAVDKSGLCIYTDAHSLETELWMSDDEQLMLPKIINEIVDSETIFEAKQKVKEIYKKTYDTAYEIGLIRCSCMKNHWGVRMDYVLSKEMYECTGDFDINVFLEHVLEHGQRSLMKGLIDSVERMRNEKVYPWLIMQGHDISTSFVYFIKKYCTIYAPNAREWENIETAVKDFESRTRQACNIEKLKSMPLFKNIEKWYGAFVN